MGGRYAEEELEVNEEKDLVAVQHQMYHQRLHARVALHLAVGQYVIGQVVSLKPLLLLLCVLYLCVSYAAVYLF